HRGRQGDRARAARRQGQTRPAGAHEGRDLQTLTRGAPALTSKDAMKLKINGKEHDVAVPEEMPLLWVLRDVVGLTGTKFGCGMAQCGACTVHLDGKAVRSCVLPVSAVGKRAITTIEGLSPDGQHPVQRAWVEEDVVQCGYCQPGQIM